MTVALLSARDLGKRMGREWLFRGLSLELRSGEGLAIIGKNGEGKTTLLDVLSGDVACDAGAVMLAGHPLAVLPAWQRARRGLGRLHQDAGPFASLTAYEAVWVGQRSRWSMGLFGHPRSLMPESQIDALLDLLGLSGDRAGPARRLSVGNQRLLAIARLIAQNPKVLVLDEPTAGLSSEAKERVGVLLSRLRSQGTGMIIAEHDHEFIGRMADRTLRLENGRLHETEPDRRTMIAKP